MPIPITVLVAVLSILIALLFAPMIHWYVRGERRRDFLLLVIAAVVFVTLAVLWR